MAIRLILTIIIKSRARLRKVRIPRPLHTKCVSKCVSLCNYFKNLNLIFVIRISKAIPRTANDDNDDLCESAMKDNCEDDYDSGKFIFQDNLFSFFIVAVLKYLHGDIGFFCSHGILLVYSRSLYCFFCV